jgi:Novel STAND NTPase 1
MIGARYATSSQAGTPPARSPTSRATCARAGALDAQILIPIDQFEELFGVATSDEANRFLALLSAALADDLPYLAVAALRADFLGLLQRAERLTAPFEEFSLKPMPLARIPEIIEGPARVAGLEVEHALAMRASEDAATEDALPLIAFALRELYERFGAKTKRLALEDYLRLGDPAAGLSHWRTPSARPPTTCCARRRRARTSSRRYATPSFRRWSGSTTPANMCAGRRYGTTCRRGRTGCSTGWCRRACW